MGKRWEFCPHCGDGWPDYIGETETHHEFSCTYEECEGYFRVKKGTGNWDKRVGMALDPKIVYMMECDGCHRQKSVQLKGSRMLCMDCFKKFKPCNCVCTCDLD